MSQLKDFFDRPLVVAIGRSLKAAHTSFDARAFVKRATTGLDALELMDRGAHIATAMHACLPAVYEDAIAILVAAPDVELPRASNMGSFRYLPHTTYIATHGLEHFEASMRAQHHFTQRFTAEFSIRPFLVRYPAQTLARLATWASDPSEHVRRLVSEGTRPRLPWGLRLRAFVEDPTPVLALLERLVDDPAEYVRRSVANNLNDIAKDHPDVVVETCTRWLGERAERRWIVERALRTLVKKGDRGALRVLGVGGTPKVAIETVTLPRRVRIGDALALSFELASTGGKPQELAVDFAVHYVKANGSRSPKVFKLKRVSLAKAGRVRLEARVSFKDMTTRTHHPGEHLVEARVNVWHTRSGRSSSRAEKLSRRRGGGTLGSCASLRP